MKEYYKKICESVNQVKDWPVNSDNIRTMAALMYIKERCEKCEDYKEAYTSDAQADHAHSLSHKTAEVWTDGMINADGTKGPHFSWAKAQEIMQQYGVDQDYVEFWAALNATYSDMCAFFKKYNINTIDAYVDHTLDFWFRDQDAVKDKLAAYYTYVVKH